jgi:threonine dehydrogenase-like Zn-dependent dehydrogenase
MIATKQVDLSPLIDKSYALADAAEAFEKATTTPSYRVILNP